MGAWFRFSRRGIRGSSFGRGGSLNRIFSGFNTGEGCCVNADSSAEIIARNIQDPRDPIAVARNIAAFRETYLARGRLRAQNR